MYISGINFDDYIRRNLDPDSKILECALCGKQVKHSKFNLRKHIENIHFPGLFAYSCKVCGITLPTANKLNHHMNRCKKSSEPSQT